MGTGDLTQISLGSLRLQPGEQWVSGCEGGGRSTRQGAACIIWVSVKDHEGAVEAVEAVGFWRGVLGAKMF